VMIGLLLASLFLMPACGGSSSGGSGGGGGGGGGGCSGCSPAGTYTVIITGVGADSAMATNATSVVLTIN
jgi:hypothetical protein